MMITHLDKVIPSSPPPVPPAFPVTAGAGRRCRGMISLENSPSRTHIPCQIFHCQIHVVPLLASSRAAAAPHELWGHLSSAPGALARARTSCGCYRIPTSTGPCWSYPKSVFQHMLYSRQTIPAGIWGSFISVPSAGRNVRSPVVWKKPQSP